jgi:hypothetical protein
MKKIVLLSSLVAANMSVAGQLNNFDDVKLAVTTGQSIHIAIDFAQCAPSQKSTSPLTHIGVFTPNEVQVVDDSIATSLIHFTLNNPSYPNTPIYEFIRYTITSDNNVTLSYQSLDARNYSPLGTAVSLNCKMGAGAKIYFY